MATRNDESSTIDGCIEIINRNRHRGHSGWSVRAVACDPACVLNEIEIRALGAYYLSRERTDDVAPEDPTPPPRPDEVVGSRPVDELGNTDLNNTGMFNSGVFNSGYRNTGHWNSGHYNTGNFNSGSRNSDDGNSGYFNTGCFNAGRRNSGNWNSGDGNAGCFNSTTPDDVRVFNKPMTRDVWDRAMKPVFIHNIKLTYWVDYDSMTDEQKFAHSLAKVEGGWVVSRTYAEAWRKAWDETTDADRRLVLSLPNFDPDVFKEITGIDVRAELGV